MLKVVRAVLSLALLVVVYSSVLVLSSVQAAGEDSRLLPDWTLGALRCYLSVSRTWSMPTWVETKEVRLVWRSGAWCSRSV